MRLDKYLADMALGTRKDVKQIIRDKKVKVNGAVIDQAHYKVNSNDLIEVDGRKIKYEEFVYYLLNKPAGYVCTFDDIRYPPITDLINNSRKKVVPVGRLDVDTEGLIMLTNDGQLNHILLSPKNHIKKTYYVETNEILSDNAKELLEKPIDLGDFITQKAEVTVINLHSALLTIQEGKYHQVKRMFLSIGNKVTFLKRISFGPFNLQGIEEAGSYRMLKDEEIAMLKKIKTGTY